MNKNLPRRKPRLNKKFRFQLMVEWLTNNFEPLKVLDVGGGKGLLSYMLIQKGWESIVVDPADSLPFHKFKNIETGERVRVSEASFKNIPKIFDLFEPSMVKDVDLVIGLHAHGSNIQIINACSEYGKDFLLMPCCVVDEPLTKESGINWFESLVSYSSSLGFEPKIDYLNFKGKNKFLYTEKYLKRLK